MAYVRARHSKRCALDRGAARAATETAPKAEGCTCSPTYLARAYVDGKKVYRRLGKNLRRAEVLAARLTAEVDEGSYHEPKKVRFREFSARWLDSLERKGTTKDSYRSSIAYANEVLGSRWVRSLRAPDVAEFNRYLRELVVAEGTQDKPERKLSASTRAKHLRVLAACLESACRQDYLGRNPVKRLPKGEKPRAAKKEAAYFDTNEIGTLFAHMPEGTSRTLLLTALKTGLRLGELIALRWGDVELLGRVIHVRHSYTGGHLSTPKSHERRHIDLADDTGELLEEWWRECGSPDEAELVFSADSGGYFSDKVVRGALYRAMGAAGIPREGPTGEKRVPHSLRHSFAKVALENGRSLFWLSRHLGHHSQGFTATVYGHFEREAARQEAQKMAGVFGV